MLGIFQKGDKALLIEDAIVTADTAIGFVKRLREDKLIVKDLISICDVGASGRDNLKKNSVRLHALFTWKELVETFRSGNPGFLSGKMNKIIDRII